MTPVKTKKSTSSQLDSFNFLIIDAIQDIKGKKIVELDLRKLDEKPADYFIICEGESSTQIKAIADNISKKLFEKTGIKPYRKEGVTAANWVLVDYFDVVVHVFHPETRHFYEIEELWGDAKMKTYEDV